METSEIKAKVNFGNKAIDSPISVPKKVTILTKDSESAYFRKNAKYMPESKNRIGSSITGVSRMRSNPAELAKYMPMLIGIDSNNPKYNELVEAWFNNISVIISDGGKNLEIGFNYDKESDYIRIKALEDDIYKEFESAKKVNSKDRNAAFELRTNKLIELEKTKYRYGLPINLADYMLWRWCLVYGDVAVDVSLINVAGHIRFYIHDADREKYKSEVQFATRNKAMALYVKLLEEPDKASNILWVYRQGALDVSTLDKTDKYMMLSNLANSEPNKLIAIYDDKDLDIKATIERMINSGILKRLENSNVIVDENNDIIGNSTDEAIVFFKNSEGNKAAITRLKAKLRDLGND